MKKLMAVLAAMAFVVVMAGGAWADVTGDVEINATVSGKCNAITANDLTLTIDPATTSDVVSTGADTTVKCTNKKTFNVAAVSGTNVGASGTLSSTLKSAGKTDIPYTLTYTSSFTGAGFGGAAAQELVADNAAVVTAANANAAEEGSYSDTVTITVEY